ncbi:MAG: helix-turn-helix transcriptional regulator [Nitrosarchaeum sp.]|nr:helix-turn-helix transcriptional regulator [Nitrosarchaeum sp.]
MIGDNRLADFKILDRESKLRKDILKALSDEYSRSIMNFTIEKPKSVVEIVKECDIPMTTAYRRVNELEENKILKVTGSVVTDDGKKYFLYQNRLKSIYVIFGLESLDVQIVENEGMGTSSYW